MASLRVVCPAIECEGCAASIERSLAKLAGVQGVRVNPVQKTVAVEYEADRVTDAALRARLTQAGFPPA